MKAHIRTYLMLLTMGLFGAPAAFAQSCTQTLSPGANVGSAVASAANGATICLNSGDYGTVDLFNITKSTNYVTVRSTTGAGAKGNWRIGNSQFIRLASVTGSIALNSCSRNIDLLNTVGTPNSSEGIFIDGSSCPTTAQNITIDGAVLDRVGQSGGEGRLSIRGGNTITIRNSKILGVWTGSPSDGVQLYDQARNISIGPNNVFSGIDQNICNAGGGAHCDVIQNYSGNGCANVRIEGNLFKDSSTFMLTESRCTGTNTFSNNVLVNIGDAQWHTWQGLTYSHNTHYNSQVRINQASDFANSATFRDNIFHNSRIDTSGAYPCSGCTLTSSVFSSGGSGTNYITGTPSYSGGAPSSSLQYQGWQLAAGSVGKGNASDGKDRGVNISTASAPTNPTPPPTNPTLPAPTNLKVN